MKKFLVLSSLVLALLSPRKSLACTIPVFRFALENWELSAYDILVYHRGPLSPELQASLKTWTQAPARANVEIATIDRDGKMTLAQEKLWKREGNDDASTWMLVRTPSAGAKEPSAWKGPCTPETLKSVLASPTRDEILAQLARGSSIVFVFLTGDDKETDKKRIAMLKKQLPILEKGIKLPVQSKDGPQIRLPLPLKVDLPLLMLDRKDPSEVGLVRLLLALEEDLDKEKGPILFPIFGRGRVFPSLYGDNLNKVILHEATEFLCKDCSCMVKNLNPGVDLLLAANWSQIIDKLFETKSAAPAPAKEPPSAPPVRATPIPASSAVATETQPAALEGRNGLWIATAIAAVLALASGGWLAWMLRR